MYLKFQQKLSSYPLFSIDDVLKYFPSFDRKSLVRWQGKGYIKKIRNKFYFFSGTELNESFLFLVANKIYKPSYVSLESALAYYNIIPEGVFAVQSVSSIKTNSFNTVLGTFVYKHLKPSLLFGYKVSTSFQPHYKIASLEKAILDYLYLNYKLQSQDDFEMLRWNKEELKQINESVFDSYLTLYNSKALKNRADRLFKYMYA